MAAAAAIMTATTAGHADTYRGRANTPTFVLGFYTFVGGETQKITDVTFIVSCPR
jgi:hypothetical protein